MRISQRCLALAILLIGTFQLCVSGCAHHGQSSNAAFLQAAKAAGAPIRSEEIVTHRSGIQTVTIAPITTWERTPATELRGGVDVAFTHLSSPTREIPAGYYTLRATADVSNTGTIPATIHFVDRDGKVAGQMTATTQVHSLTIPEQASTRRSYVTANDELQPNGQRLIIIVICCPNGDCLVIIFL